MMTSSSKSDQIMVHNYDTRIRQTTNLLQNEISSENFKLIKRYHNVMIGEALAKATQLKHLQILLNLTRFVKKDWTVISKDDIDSLVATIMIKYASDNGQETSTSWDHKKILKIFFRWVKLDSRNFRLVGDPPETKNVRLKKVKDNISREDLLTESDRTRLLHACGGNLRDKAFLDCHSEAGTRPGEILNLKIKHVKFDKYGAVLQVDGKTGPRTIRLITSTPNLAKWLDAHPFKDNPDAPLWISLEHTANARPLTYPAARKLLERRCKIAGITKRVNLKLFRHSEATNTAKFMTEAQLRNRHGWTNSSNMPSRYVHLINSDVDDALFKHHGIKKPDEIHTTVQKCHFCNLENSSESTICSSCGRPLNLNVIEKIKEAEQTEIKKLSDRIETLEEENKLYHEIEPDLKQLTVDSLDELNEDELLKLMALNIKHCHLNKIRN